MVIFAQKNLFLVQKIGYGYGGYPPPFTDKIRKVVFDHLPNLIMNITAVMLLAEIYPQNL